MHLRCGGIFNDHFIMHLLLSEGERIFKIGQQLAKLWARVWCRVFLTHGVYYVLLRMASITSLSADLVREN